jgi:hypothetical protein
MRSNKGVKRPSAERMNPGLGRGQRWGDEAAEQGSRGCVARLELRSSLQCQGDMPSSPTVGPVRTTATERRDGR